jgi:hypothetical protein
MLKCNVKNDNEGNFKIIQKIIHAENRKEWKFLQEKNLVRVFAVFKISF